MRELESFITYITGFIIGALIAAVICIVYFKSHPFKEYPKHEIGIDKIQWGVGVTCCGDTICIPEYREYMRNHLTKDAKQIPCCDTN